MVPIIPATGAANPPCMRQDPSTCACAPTCAQGQRRTHPCPLHHCNAADPSHCVPTAHTCSFPSAAKTSPHCLLLPCPSTLHPALDLRDTLRTLRRRNHRLQPGSRLNNFPLRLCCGNSCPLAPHCFTVTPSGPSLRQPYSVSAAASRKSAAAAAA